MKTISNLLPLFGVLFLWSSCTFNSDESISADVQRIGLKPIYASTNDWQTIDVSDPIPIRRLGKIYYKDNFIFVNELYEGIHIIDNTNPASPTFVKFVRIVGSKDIAIKGDYLYADNINDLVVLNIADFNNIRLENRVRGLYPQEHQLFPQAYQGFFECADESRVVIGWEEAELNDPKCWK